MMDTVVDNFMVRFGLQIIEVVDAAMRRHKTPVHLHLKGVRRKLRNGLTSFRGHYVVPCYDPDCHQEESLYSGDTLTFMSNAGNMEIVTRPTTKKVWRQ